MPHPKPRAGEGTSIVPAALAAIRQHALLELVGIGEGHRLDATQPAEIADLHDAPEIGRASAWLAALERAQLPGTLDQHRHDVLLW